MNILLVEDNLTIAKGLIYTLENNNFKVVCKNTVSAAIKYLENEIDLMILDITLPDGDGFEFYEQYVLPKKIKTIFLTAKDEEEDIVKGLTLGADDYITKPFRPLELIARINKIMSKYTKESIIKINDIKFDLDKMLVYKKDKEIKLTSLEIKILQLLFLNKGKVVSRNTILDKIWEWTGNDVDDHTVTVYLKRIREKLNSDIIKTVKGIGYRIDEE